MNKNPLLRTDVYKMGHMTQYAPGTTKVYSGLVARSDKYFKEMVFFGLNYYLREYLSRPITREMAREFLDYREKILGKPNPADVTQKIYELAELGYWPLKIKAVEEGTILPTKNVVMTITNTFPEFYWCVGFVESLLLKVWYPCVVSTHSLAYKRLVRKFFEETVGADQQGLLPFMVHDFGYRGDSSEEGSVISGAAHLLHFSGSDTVPAYPFINEFYPPYSEAPVMCSVPASEHSVMCSFGREGELDAYRHMLKDNPTGIVSIVSDTFDIWNVLTSICSELKDEILQREGKVVFRPDSGDPEEVICGYRTGFPDDFPEAMGCIRLLDKTFGHTVNEKGFKVLNEKVGLIYGDGMYFERYERILNRLKEMGYAASNLVIGVGGILRHHTRDTLGFAIKATYVEVNGEEREIEKDPVTDQGKKSHKGLLHLGYAHDLGFWTEDQVSPEQEKKGNLLTVFLNGKVLRSDYLEDLRKKTEF